MPPTAFWLFLGSASPPYLPSFPKGYLSAVRIPGGRRFRLTRRRLFLLLTYVK